MNFSPRKWKICKSRESRVQGIGRLIVEKMTRLTLRTISSLFLPFI